MLLQNDRPPADNMLPVSILTLQTPSTSEFTSVCEVSFELDHPQRSHGIVQIFKMADVSYVEFAVR